jgi:hypothetical protein
MAAATKNIPDPEELVTYKAPLFNTRGRRDDIVVGVNGELIKIKRGETVQIKRKFLEVIENSEEQDLKAIQLMDKLQRESDKEIARM